MKLRLLALVSLVAALGCNPSPSPCARVICDPGWTCEPTTGVCLRPDGGTTDGGTTDAGATCDPACPNGLVCDGTTATCVQCLTDSNCSCPNPVCGSAHQCGPASGDAGVTQLVGDSCLTPAPLVFANCGNVAQFSVDLSVLSDDESGSCSAPMSFGKDAVYTLTLTQPQDVTITATPIGGSQPVIYLRAGACEAGTTELACRDGLGGTATIHVKSLPAGTYWLVIDSYDASGAGPVDVSVVLDPPTMPFNEACGTAAPLDLDGGSVVVDLSTADDDDKGSCNLNADAPEVVYVASLSQPADLHLSAIPAADGGLALIYVRQSPCASGKELVCADPTSGAPTLRLRALAAGDYYVFVEANDRAHAGPVTVTASASAASPPPPNDTCTAPRLITFAPGSNTVSIPVDTSEASDDYTGSCNATPDSPEVVFQLHLNATSQVDVSAAPSPGSYADPVLYMRTLPCDFPAAEVFDPDSGMLISDAGTELGCDHEAPPTPDELSGTLDPGDYFIYVEGYGLTGAGPTTLTVTVN